MAEPRLLGVDFLRAAGCLLVFAHHTMFRVDYDTAPLVAQHLIDFLLIGSFGVSVFFMLSGFLLARPFWLALDAGKPMPSLRTYAIRRAARILPGFWLALTVTFLLSFLLMGAPLSAQLVGRYVAGLFLVSDWHWVTLFPVEFNGPLWSIGFEVTSYVLLPLCLIPLFRARPVGGSVLASRLVWLAVIVLVLLLHDLIVAYAPIDDVNRGWNHGIIGGAKQWMPRYNPIGFFAIFALGALAAGIQVLIRHQKAWGYDMLCMVGLVGAGLAMGLSMHGPTEGFAFLSIPYGFPHFPIAIGIVLIAAPSSRLFGRLADNPVSRFFAKISFGIYLWHFLIIALMGRYLHPAFDNKVAEPFINWLLSGAGALAISVAVATASFYLLEQPVVRWARGLEKRRDPAKAESASLAAAQ